MYKRQVQNRTGTILNNTNGVQDLVTNVRGVTSGFRSGVVSDLQVTLGEAQDLIAFLKERRESAGSPADYPDLSILITNLESIVGILQDNPNGGDFGVLTQLLQVLPEKLLAVAARGVSKAGIDGEFVNRINQTALDLDLLTDTIRQDTQDEENQPAEVCTFQVGKVYTPGVDELPCQTSCTNYNSNRKALKIAANGAASNGLYMKITGELLAGVAKTTATYKGVGIHGYADYSISTDPAQAIGKIIAALGAGSLSVASTINNKLKHCEILYHQAEIMESNQQVLDSNAAMLEEVCQLTRYRSANCQALLP